MTIDMSPTKMWKQFLLVATFLFAIVLIAVLTQAQQLQKGVSVQLAATRNAAPMPEADAADAWIITVTADGSLYFGATPVTSDELTDEMRARPRRRDAMLYLKADARTPFAAVKKVLAAAHDVGFTEAVLLASQPAPAAPGTIIEPEGLIVQIEPPSAESIEVQLDAGPSPMLKVNQVETSWTALPDTLWRQLKNRKPKAVVVNAAGQVPFARVAAVIDAARPMGATVAIVAPAL